MATKAKANPERKDYHYSVWVDAEQRDLIDRAALAAGEERASTWLRKLAVRAAKDQLDRDRAERKAAR